jgi:hypothetical protein
LLSGLDPHARFIPDHVESGASALRFFALDPRARDELGRGGRVRQQEFFSIDGQVAGTDTVYRDAIARRDAERGGIR